MACGTEKGEEAPCRSRSANALRSATSVASRAISIFSVTGAQVPESDGAAAVSRTAHSFGSITIDTPPPTRARYARRRVPSGRSYIPCNPPGDIHPQVSQAH